MPAHARNHSVDPLKIEVHHVWTRCVRGAWLCGVDPLTKVDYSHRREWIESLLEYQASVFAIDVGGYHILNNHKHGVLRTRPDVAQRWSDEEVAWRWRLAWPKFENEVWQRVPTDEQIKSLLTLGAERIAKLRKRLSSLSWFMARWKQPIAWICNRESNVRGHHFEQRFGNRRLDSDEESVVAFIYGDLQQVKAGIVDSVEASDYSAIQRQIRAEAEKALQQFRGHGESPQCELELEQVEALYANCFLAPISDQSPLLSISDDSPPARELVLPIGYVTPGVAAKKSPEIESTSRTKGAPPESQAAERPRRGRPRRKSSATRHERLARAQRRRATRQSILNMPWEQYYDLVKRAEARCLEDRRRTAPTPTPTPTPTKPSGAIPDNMTSGAWAAEFREFGAWLSEIAAQLPPHLRRLCPTPRGDPPAASRPGSSE